MYKTQRIKTPTLKAELTKTLRGYIIDTQVIIDGKWQRLELMYTLKDFKKVYEKHLTVK